MRIIETKIYLKCGMELLKLLGSDKSMIEWVKKEIERIRLYDLDFGNYLNNLYNLDPPQAMGALSVYRLFETQEKEDKLNAIAQSN